MLWQYGKNICSNLRKLRYGNLEKYIYVVGVVHVKHEIYIFACFSKGLKVFVMLSKTTHSQPAVQQCHLLSFDS